MNRYLRLASGVLLLLSLAATPSLAQDKKDKGEKKPAPADNYFPLEVGNKWTYKISVGDKNVAAIAHIKKSETINDVVMARLETTVDDKVVTTEHLTQTKAGIFRHRFNGQEVEPPLCVLKYPVKSGNKWNGEFTVDGETAKYTCEAKEDAVEGPTGKHKAIRSSIRLNTQGQDVSTVYWFVNNIGYVKQTVDLGGIFVEAELEKFEPGKQPAGTKAAEPFNGKDLTGWKLRGDMKKNKWEVGTATVNDKGGLVFKAGGSELVNTAGGGIDIYTEQEFGDCTVEIEVMVPKGSNSGIYLMGRYEIQVLDSFGVKKLGMGDMGAIYSIAVPKLNASKKPGEWQKYVIEFQAPRFEDKKKVANAVFKKVTLNDQIIHENAEATKGVTGGSLSGNEVPVGPLMLQGDHGPVAFRNVRITAKK